MKNDMMLCVAPNGARLGKADHPALPITPDELADCAEDCVKAGAAMIHLHVRDSNERHVLDAGRYKDAIYAIRDRMGDNIVIQVTTEAVGQYQAEQQRDMVQSLKPEAVSLGLRELLPDGADEQTFAKFWQWMNNERIWPQVILYDENDIQRFLTLRNKGIFGQHHLSILIVLGRYGQQLAKPQDLLPSYHLIKDQPDLDWSVCAFGQHENACISMAATLGGHGRIGFENNRLLADGSTAPNNAELVAQAALSARLTGREPMSAATLRSLRIKRLNGE